MLKHASDESDRIPRKSGVVGGKEEVNEPGNIVAKSEKAPLQQLFTVIMMKICWSGGVVGTEYISLINLCCQKIDRSMKVVLSRYNQSYLHPSGSYKVFNSRVGSKILRLNLFHFSRSHFPSPTISLYTSLFFLPRRLLAVRGRLFINYHVECSSRKFTHFYFMI